MHDVGHCHDHRDRRDRHDLEGHLGHRDLDHPGRQIRDLRLDLPDVAPCRVDRHLDHRGDPLLDSSDATDRRCRRDRDRAHSAECDPCAPRCQLDADHRGHDQSGDADLHWDGAIRRAAVESGARCRAAAESVDHSARGAAVVRPAEDEELWAESGAALAHSAKVE